jgi:HD superfamily phosphohydrolase
MSRKIFKAEKIAKDASIEDVQAEKSKELIKLNLDPDYYLDTVSIASKPYSFYNPDSSDYQKAIFVATDEGKLEEISKISHVVKSLVSNEFTSTWLIYADLDLSNLSSSSSSATRFNNISRVTPI